MLWVEAVPQVGGEKRRPNMRAWALKAILVSLIFRHAWDLSCQETKIIASEKIRLKLNHFCICLKYTEISKAPQNSNENVLLLCVATWLVEFIFLIVLMSLNTVFASLIYQIFLSDLVLCNSGCTRQMFWEIAALLSWQADSNQSLFIMPQSFA